MTLSLEQRIGMAEAYDLAIEANYYYDRVCGIQKFKEKLNKAAAELLLKDDDVLSEDWAKEIINTCEDRLAFCTQAFQQLVARATQLMPDREAFADGEVFDLLPLGPVTSDT